MEGLVPGGVVAAAADGVRDFVHEADGDVVEEAEAAAGGGEVEAGVGDVRILPVHVD